MREPRDDDFVVHREGWGDLPDLHLLGRVFERDHRHQGRFEPIRLVDDDQIEGRVAVPPEAELTAAVVRLQ